MLSVFAPGNHYAQIAGDSYIWDVSRLPAKTVGGCGIYRMTRAGGSYSCYTALAPFRKDPGGPTFGAVFEADVQLDGKVLGIQDSPTVDSSLGTSRHPRAARARGCRRRRGAYIVYFGG